MPVGQEKSRIKNCSTLDYGPRRKLRLANLGQCLKSAYSIYINPADGTKASTVNQENRIRIIMASKITPNDPHLVKEKEDFTDKSPSDDAEETSKIIMKEEETRIDVDCTRAVETATVATPRKGHSPASSIPQLHCPLTLSSLPVSPNSSGKAEEGCFSLTDCLSTVKDGFLGLVYFLMAVELLALVIPVPRILERIFPEEDDAELISSIVSPVATAGLVPLVDVNGEEELDKKAKKEAKEQPTVWAIVLEEFVSVTLQPQTLKARPVGLTKCH